MRRKRYDFLDLILNGLIVLTTAWAVLMYFIGKPDILGSHDVACFKYFTTDSNILSALASLLYLIFRWRSRRTPEKAMPSWLAVFKFIGTVAASITLLTVVLFLAPMSAVRGHGFRSVLLFFTGNVFVLHLSTPVLSLLSTLLLEPDTVITRRQAVWGLLPTAAYSMLYLTMVVLLKQWNDWYGFTFGGRYELVPVVMAVMLLFSLGVSLAEQHLKSKASRIMNAHRAGTEGSHV